MNFANIHSTIGSYFGGILVGKNMKGNLRVPTWALKIPSATTAARSKVQMIEIYCQTRHRIRNFHNNPTFLCFQAFSIESYDRRQNK